MEPWYKNTMPRAEIREGRSFNPNEFAIALEQVGGWPTFACLWQLRGFRHTPQCLGTSVVNSVVGQFETPAMEAGLADRVWSVEDLVGLLGEDALESEA